MEHIKVGIVEDDVIISESLATSIGMVASMSLAFVAGSVEEALEAISDVEFEGVDVILQDIGLPGMNGIEGLQAIRKLVPDVNIIMLTTYEETDKIFAALCNGAQSYISKKTSLRVIMEAIFTIHRGGAYMSPSIARKIIDHLGSPTPIKKLDERLTDLQMEIVAGLGDGLSYKMLASRFNITIDSVRAHIKKIYKILEVNSKVEVMNMYKSS